MVTVIKKQAFCPAKSGVLWLNLPGDAALDI
jgi:hypothetical protein